MSEYDPLTASKRLDILLKHLNKEENTNKNSKEWRTLSPSQCLIVCTNRDRKWNGYGYKDTFFKFDERGTAFSTGNRYPNFSSKEFHELRPWLEQTLRINLKTICPAQPNIIELPSPNVNHEFYDAIKPQGIMISFAEQDRLSHGHGISTAEIYRLRHGNFARIPDAVIWPETHEQVVIIVKAALKFNVGCIPYGSGSNDVDALECPKENMKRMIVSLDMRQMNRILSLSKENMYVIVEAGTVAQNLEKELRKQGFTLGWDSEMLEFCTVGGIVSLRSNDIKRNMTGDLEHSVINFKMVTPTGTIQRSGIHTSQISSGPNFQLLFGTEGTLGVITELTLKIHFFASQHHYVSIYFPSFHNGLLFLRDIAQKKIIRFSGARLVDEPGLQLVHAFNTTTPTIGSIFYEVIKNFYLKKIKNLEVGKMCLAAILIDGDDIIKLKAYEKTIGEIGKQYGGVIAGYDLGERMFLVSKRLPYLRDFLLDHYAISDRLDATASWTNVEILVEKVKEKITNTCKVQNIRPKPYIGVRIDHIYDTGASITFTYGFNCRNLGDPLGVLRLIEQVALDEILQSNGSVSHNTSGIGKRKKESFRESLDEPVVNVLKNIKKTLDPTNIFCNQNLI
ncbi:alkyldihydroxyacetonephosphate synthase, peroxisomal [Gigaspora margarita]|uniref:Alkylglycerone-phosphate synthase n=1 Tax=Gigaspora margarita TaxID=4874 RepID=A0A8H3X4W3_GIGMA|nr:alkyldihydroxyacetonephosphate synthase, peroxisomal [Gigaspora margarita]